MIYVFDTSSLIDVFQHYYRNRFPSFWTKFDDAVTSQRIICVREVLVEIDQGNDKLTEWAKSHRDFFHLSSPEEFVFVQEIFKVSQFQALVSTQSRLLGRPVADPFVIAKAKLVDGCVVTQESQVRVAKIPNICGHFKIKCLDLEGFMEQEDWTF